MKYTGQDGSITAGGAPIVELISFTVEEGAETVDTPTMDGTCAKDVEVSTIFWNGTIEAFYDPVDAGLSNIGIGETVAAVFNPTGAGGVESLSGLILITAIAMPVETDSMIIQSYTFEGKGVLTKALI